MASSAQDLVAVIGKARILPAEQLKVLQAQASKFPDAKTLAKELVRGGYLTMYQVGQLAKGGKDLYLEPYILLDKLGEGGMGAVYKAKHATLGRIVAVKLIRKERLANPDVIKRFHQEIRAAAQLEHPNVVRAFDADEVDGTHFFVMEFVEGTDLAKVVKDGGPLPIATACDYIRQAALGLQHAFERGMVHRDIKPANLLVATPPAPPYQGGEKTGHAPPSKGGENTKHSPPLEGGAGGVVKILDMGLARSTTGEHDESTALTQEGSVMGTPDYIAPEQAISSHEVDIRADLYSLGCSLYFLLTGQPPFPKGSMTEKLLKHQMDEPAPLQSLRPEVPLGVVAIVRRLMAKKPDERFQTPAELAVALADPDAYAASTNQETVSMVTARPRPSAGSDTLPDASRQWADLTSAPETEEVVAAPTAIVKQKPTRPAWMLYAIGGSGVLVLLVVLLIWRPWRGRSDAAPPPPQAAGKKGPSAEPPKPVPPFQPVITKQADSLAMVVAGPAVAIFNGNDLSGWKAQKGDLPSSWSVGAAALGKAAKQLDVTPGGTDMVNHASGACIYSEREFGDCIIEVDVMVAKGANSGIYIMGEYEIQVFDSFGKMPINATDMGALYNAATPRVNACKAPGEWQSFRIEFRAPRFEGGQKVANARLLKVELNGQVIHENVEITKVSGQGRTGQERSTGPVYLQGNLGGGVAFRNFRVTDAIADSPTLVNLKELNTEPHQWLPWITADGLAIYFERGGEKIFMSRRKDATSAFGPPVEVAVGRHPAVRWDEKEIIVSKDNKLASARRASIDKPFGAPVPIDTLDAPGRTSMPFLMQSGTLLIYQRRDGATIEFRKARRATIDAPWQPTGLLPMKIPDDFAGKLSWPFLTQDYLTLLCVDEGDVARGKFMVWTRKDSTEPFADFRYVDLPGLGDLKGRAPRWVEKRNELFFTAPPNRTDDILSPWNGSHLWVVRPLDLRQLTTR